MKRCVPLVLCLLLVVSVVLAACGSRETIVIEDPFAVTASQSSSSNATPAAQSWSGMPPVYVVSGSNYEMGYQYALQAAPLMYHNYAATWSRLVAELGEEATRGDLTVWWYYLKKYNPGIEDWYEGMVDGCKKMGYKVDVLQLLSISMYPTIFWARPDLPYPTEAVKTVAAKAAADLRQEMDPAGSDGYHSCHAFAGTGDATADQKTIVSVSKMVPFETGQCGILIAFPDDGPSFIAAPQAGQIAANSGMNNAGFASACTAIFAEKAWSYPMEGTFAYMPQYATSTANALKYLESVPRGGVMGTCTMGDATGNVAVFESTASEYKIRKPGDCGEPKQFMVQTNHLVHADMQHWNPPNVKTGGSWFRYQTLYKYASDAAGASGITLDTLKNAFSSDDWYDPATNTWHRNEPGSPNTLNSFASSVTQAILFPGDRTAYYEIGTPSGIGVPSGATGQYMKFQLADDPKGVADNVARAAWAYYSEARNLFQHDVNAQAEYLPYLVAQSLEEMLDEAMLAYDLADDRAANAYLTATGDEQMALWSEALTQYAKCQLVSQMVTSTMKALAE